MSLLLSNHLPLLIKEYRQKDIAEESEIFGLNVGFQIHPKPPKKYPEQTAEFI